VNEERLGSPVEFARRLTDHLDLVREAQLPLPGAADLVQLVEVVFFASLHEEEGRPSVFNVAWQPGSADCGALVAITSPVPVTPKNLAKLAPATQRDATSIAVRRVAGGLVAWALLQRSAAAAPPLTIWSLAPGVLRVDYAGVPRALYARGESWLLGGAQEVKSPSRTLTRIFEHWRNEAAPSVGIDLRAAVVTRIAARALAHGHGGMLLLVPAELDEPIGVRVHYGVGDGRDMLAKCYSEVTHLVPIEQRLQRLLDSRERGLDGRVNVRDEAQIALAEAIEFVARLTSIDNAVLLDTHLRVRGFGVQVIEAEAPQIHFEHRSPYADDAHSDDLSTFRGTRHPAGVIFCMRQPREAAAIIASQDGRLSLASKDEHGVVEVLGSYERAFGWR
jgi:hypothetical protein